MPQGTRSPSTLQRISQLRSSGMQWMSDTPLACDACHKQPADKVKLSMECASCHTRQDVHQGRFGRDCDRCHDTRSFKQPRVLH